MTSISKLILGAAALSFGLFATTTTAEAGSAKFPAVVKKFHKMNELKQESFAEKFPGTILSGKGKVTSVEKCGFLDDSKKYGSNCYKVIIDSGIPRVALYYGNKDKAKIAEYEEGKRLSFKNCKANSIKNWGFWSTATCDMP